MEYEKLNYEIEMPNLSFGVFQIPDSKQCEQSVAEATKTGYRLLDTAASYSDEKAVGNAIKSSGISRSELFVPTKVWIQNVGYKTRIGALAKVRQRYFGVVSGPQYSVICSLKPQRLNFSTLGATL